MYLAHARPNSIHARVYVNCKRSSPVYSSDKYVIVARDEED